MVFFKKGYALNACKRLIVLFAMLKIAMQCNAMYTLQQEKAQMKKCKKRKVHAAPVFLLYPSIYPHSFPALDPPIFLYDSISSTYTSIYNSPDKW